MEAIDAGLQESTEHGFGEGDWPWSPGDVKVCVRCRGPLEDGDVCAGCRAFLLEDSDTDPLRPITRGRADDGWTPGEIIMEWYRQAQREGRVVMSATRVAEDDLYSQLMDRAGITVAWQRRVATDLVRSLDHDDAVDSVRYAYQQLMPRRAPSFADFYFEWLNEAIGQYHAEAAEQGLIPVDVPTIEFDDESRGLILYGHGYRLVHADGTSQALDAAEIVWPDVPASGYARQNTG